VGGLPQPLGLAPVWQSYPEAAFKRFRLFISILNRRLYGKWWLKKGVGIQWVCAMERQRRGVVHFHTLLRSPELLALLKSSWSPAGHGGRYENAVMELWNELAGFARIEPIDSAEAVMGYVSKYVTKGGEIELGGPGMAYRRSAGDPARVDRSWLTTEVGRASAATVLAAVTSPEEREALLARYGEQGSRRGTAELLTDVRRRCLAYRAGYREAVR
jgi:hypothetical protein